MSKIKFCGVIVLATGLARVSYPKAGGGRRHCGRGRQQRRGPGQPRGNVERKSRRYAQPKCSLEPKSERKPKVNRGAERTELTLRGWCIAQQNRAPQSEYPGPNRRNRGHGGMA